MAVIIVVLLYSAIHALIFMLLWNFIAPLFWAAAPILTFLQAWLTTILLNFFFSAIRSKS